LIKQARVGVNGVIRRDPESGVNLESDSVEVDGQPVAAAAKVYLMLNKPRGLVATRSDEQGRDTVYRCLTDRGLPWLSPVGRLDKASEGLLLFTNDTVWSDRVLAPESHLDKTYHVQVNCRADAALARRMVEGVTAREGDFLTAKRAELLRLGPRNSWLVVVLDEGKNRHLRRLLEACQVEVLRLVRVAIGNLVLGSLPKGQYRHLTRVETEALTKAGRT
jgi:23S rRNA pseudouridine2605 synthase